jgi:hypothetical protein
VVGIYPLFIVSSRLFGAQGVMPAVVSYGGIVADDAAAEQALGAEAARLARAAGATASSCANCIRCRSAWPTRIARWSPRSRSPAGAEGTFARLHSNVRNKIRKAEKSGVTVDQGAAGLADFYASIPGICAISARRC